MKHRPWLIDRVDDSPTIFRIPEGKQPLFDGAHHIPALCFIHRTVLFPAPQVHVQAVQTDRIRLCPGPIYVREAVTAGGRRRTVQLQQTLAAKPRVDVKSAVETGEAMIGHDHHGGRPGAGHDPSDGSVHPPVAIE